MRHSKRMLEAQKAQDEREGGRGSGRDSSAQQDPLLNSTVKRSRRQATPPSPLLSSSVSPKRKKRREEEEDDDEGEIEVAISGQDSRRPKENGLEGFPMRAYTTATGLSPQRQKKDSFYPPPLRPVQLRRSTVVNEEEEEEEDQNDGKEASRARLVRVGIMPEIDSPTTSPPDMTVRATKGSSRWNMARPPQRPSQHSNDDHHESPATPPLRAAVSPRLYVRPHHAHGTSSQGGYHPPQLHTWAQDTPHQQHQYSQSSVRSHATGDSGGGDFTTHTGQSPATTTAAAAGSVAEMSAFPSTPPLANMRGSPQEFERTQRRPARNRATTEDGEARSYGHVYRGTSHHHVEEEEEEEDDTVTIPTQQLSEAGDVTPPYELATRPTASFVEEAESHDDDDAVPPLLPTIATNVTSPWTTPTRGSDSDNSAEVRLGDYSGFHNNGNDCYACSVMNFILRNKVFRKYLLCQSPLLLLVRLARQLEEMKPATWVTAFLTSDATVEVVEEDNDDDDDDDDDDVQKREDDGPAHHSTLPPLGEWVFYGSGYEASTDIKKHPPKKNHDKHTEGEGAPPPPLFSSFPQKGDKRKRSTTPELTLVDELCSAVENHTWNEETLRQISVAVFTDIMCVNRPSNASSTHLTRGVRREDDDDDGDEEMVGKEEVTSVFSSFPLLDRLHCLVATTAAAHHTTMEQRRRLALFVVKLKQRLTNDVAVLLDTNSASSADAESLDVDDAQERRTLHEELTRLTLAQQRRERFVALFNSETTRQNYSVEKRKEIKRRFLAQFESKQSAHALQYSMKDLERLHFNYYEGIRLRGVAAFFSDSFFMGTQEDAHEFFVSVISKIDGECMDLRKRYLTWLSPPKADKEKRALSDENEKEKELLAPTDAYVRNNDNLWVNYLFQGKLLNIIRCKHRKCQHEIVTVDPFVNLTVSIPSPSPPHITTTTISKGGDANASEPCTLNRLVRQSVQKYEVLESYKCDHCGRKSKQIQGGCFFGSPPPLLCVQLKRFMMKQVGGGSKSGTSHASSAHEQRAEEEPNDMSGSSPSSASSCSSPHPHRGQEHADVDAQQRQPAHEQEDEDDDNSDTEEDTTPPTEYGTGVPQYTFVKDDTPVHVDDTLIIYALPSQQQPTPSPEKEKEATATTPLYDEENKRFSHDVHQLETQATSATLQMIKTTYKLQSTVLHRGTSLNYGHYVSEFAVPATTPACTKHSPAKEEHEKVDQEAWRTANDEKVTVIPSDQMRQQREACKNSYLLLYEKIQEEIVPQTIFAALPRYKASMLKK